MLLHHLFLPPNTTPLIRCVYRVSHRRNKKRRTTLLKASSNGLRTKRPDVEMSTREQSQSPGRARYRLATFRIDQRHARTRSVNLCLAVTTTATVTTATIDQSLGTDVTITTGTANTRTTGALASVTVVGQGCFGSELPVMLCNTRVAWLLDIVQC